ncbi:MAG: ribonuclease HIII [Verrucomicrobiales bacterium]|nr:ribonuclease HIII [Verrucomicrobiae bacterium]MCP5555172.1 ribonuclease HIII [Akkermansiaceae bacterium]
MAAPSTQTVALTVDQADKLHILLEERGFEMNQPPYTRFGAKGQGVTVAVYEKGPKLVIQGKGLEDFVTFLLEPEILGEARLGYEEVHQPEMFAPHIGVDESGKGDFFGPLVVAGVYVEPESARHLLAGGIVDSKRIGSDRRIAELAELVRTTPACGWEIITLGPSRYNALYAKFGNLNRLLAWGHAKIIENLLERVPDCPRALSDQFANPRELERALQSRGRTIQVDQRTKAESDIAVAAASVLARDAFVSWLADAESLWKVKLPKGASPAVTEAGKTFVNHHGREKLAEVAKMHFRTSAIVLGDL